MRSDNRRPETLFGSGQRNPNRRGRTAAAKEQGMAEIMERALHLRDASGRRVRTSLGELAEKRLYAGAMKGEPGAREELFLRYHEEQLAAIERPRRAPRTAAYRKVETAVADAIARRYAPLRALLAELEDCGVIVRVGGERFIAGWAVQAAAAARSERLKARLANDRQDELAQGLPAREQPRGCR